MWVALALAALAAAVCVLWFMTVAMRNERLAVQQRLSDVYLNHLAAAQRQLAAYWSDKEAALKSAAGGRPAEIFAALVRANLADSVIVQDARGQIVYPGSAAGPGAFQVEEPADWLPARELEFQKSNYLAAAEAYRRLAAEAGDPRVQGKALQSQAGCLLKAGQPSSAIEVLTRLARDPRFREVVGESGAVVAPNVQLRVLKLLNAPTNETSRAACADLVKRLNDYSDGLMSASQRRFLMEEVRALAPGVAGFPTLAAEQLAADYLDRNPRPAREGVMQPAGLPRVWCLGVGRPSPGLAATLSHRMGEGRLSDPGRGGAAATSASTGVVALFREERLRAEMGLALDALALPDARVQLLAPGEAIETPTALPPTDAGERLPGWWLALAFRGPDPFAAASARQARVYLWSGVLVVVVIALVALAAGRYVGAQMRLARVKNDLVATVSHELKTPLASIRALVDTLSAQRYSDPQQLEEYLQPTPHGGFTLSQRSGGERRSRPQGSPGARKGHAGQI